MPEGTGSRDMRFSIDVSADTTTAWGLISDIARHDEWSPQEFEASKLDSGPVGIGTRYRTAGRKGARKGVLRSTAVVVTEFEPTSRFGFEATERAGTYRTTFLITPTERGSHVERVVEPPTTGLVPFVRHVLARPVIRRYVQQNMDALKTKLDASPRERAHPTRSIAGSGCSPRYTAQALLTHGQLNPHAADVHAAVCATRIRKDLSWGNQREVTTWETILSAS